MSPGSFSHHCIFQRSDRPSLPRASYRSVDTDGRRRSREDTVIYHSRDALKKELQWNVTGRSVLDTKRSEHDSLRVCAALYLY
jgi:hypothetical protein